MKIKKHALNTSFSGNEKLVADSALLQCTDWKGLEKVYDQEITNKVDFIGIDSDCIKIEPVKKQDRYGRLETFKGIVRHFGKHSCLVPDVLPRVR